MTATATRPPTPPAGHRAAPSRRPSAPTSGNDVRRTLFALLASALGILPLNELFSDSGWMIDVWLSMAVVVGPAAYLRRRSSPSAAQIWIGVALLVPWLTVNFLRDQAVLGIIPLQGAWHEVGALMTDLHRTTSDDVAPVHTTVAIRLTLCAVLGLVAALVDLLAVVGRRGALAGVPLLIVFTVSGAVPRQPVTWFWFVLAAVGFLILLALDSSDDLQRWGHFVPRAKHDGRRRAAGVFTAQRIAIIAIALAVAVPVFIPSDSRNFLSDLFHNGNGGDRGGFGAEDTSGIGVSGINPFAALHGQLVRDRNLNLLRVKIASDSRVGSAKGVQPFYLRTNVLSAFRGDGWVPGPRGDTDPVDATSFASSPGTAFAPRVVRFDATITADQLRSNPPVFANPTQISGVDDTTRWSGQDQLLTGSRLTGDSVVHESVAQPQPTVADLRAATRRDPAMNAYLQLPQLAPYVRQLTTRIMRNATTPYEKARALTDFFAAPANGFTYSLSTKEGDSGDDLTDFLRLRIGFCQQYAAAMGVMLRYAGVPARVVLGYAHDVPNRDGDFTVSTFDAHAWVEAYFAGIGWVPFDPTPLSGISDGQRNDLVWAPHPKSNSGTALPNSTSASSAPTTAPTRSTTAPAAARGGGSSVSLGVPLLVVGVLVVLVVIMLVPAWIRLARRRRRRRLVQHGDVDAVWNELSDTALDLGYVWSAARSPRQVATWLQNSSDASGAAVGRLTTAVEHARYSPTASAGPDLADDLDTVIAGLEARRSRSERWRARYWPPSLGWTRPGWTRGPRRH